MKTVRILLHGLVLLGANLVGIIVGFLMYHALGASSQIETQLPIAALFSVLLYLAWVLLLRKLPFTQLTLQNTREHVLVGPCSLFWNPIVFVPLHYFTQGYLTAVGNLIALALFQVPVNAIAILAAWKATQPEDAEVSPEGAPSVEPSS